MTQSTVCLIIFFLTIALYISNKIPLALVSLASMVAMTVTGCLAPKDALANFANSTVVTMGAMMVIAAGLNRTQMLHKVTNLVYHVSGGSFTKGMLGYCLATMVVSQVMPSVTVAFTVCAPLVSDFCRKTGKSPSAGLFSCGLITITSTGALPTGAGATTYLLVNSQIAAYGFQGIESGMFDNFIVKVPSLIMAVICGAFICPKFAPDRGPLLTENEKKAAQKEILPLDPIREVLGYGIFLVVVLCMLLSNQGLVPLEVWEICMIGAFLEIATGVLSEKEALSSIMLSPIFLLVGALGVGTAVVNSGAGDIISAFLQNVLGSDPSPWVAAVIFWLTAFIITQFMSNLALVTALNPIVYLVCFTYGWNPIGFAYMVSTACFISYLTPLSTISVPYMMELGGYNQRDLLKMGWIPAILMSVATVPWAMLIYPPV